MTTDNAEFPPLACTEVRAGFCASLSNGRPRCRKGSCWLIDAPELAGAEMDELGW